MIKTGYLYQVKTNNFKDSGRRDDYCNPTEKSVPIDTILEIRYPFQWNFRTDNKYKEESQGIWGHATEEDILANCKLIGRVNNYVKIHNLENLPSILSNVLYDKFDGVEFINMPQSSYFFLFDKTLKSTLTNHPQVDMDLIYCLTNSLSDLYSIVKELNLSFVIAKFKELNDKYGTNF